MYLEQVRCKESPTKILFKFEGSTESLNDDIVMQKQNKQVDWHISLSYVRAWQRACVSVCGRVCKGWDYWQQGPRPHLCYYSILRGFIPNALEKRYLQGKHIDEHISCNHKLFTHMCVFDAHIICSFKLILISGFIEYLCYKSWTIGISNKHKIAYACQHIKKFVYLRCYFWSKSIV